MHKLLLTLIVNINSHAGQAVYEWVAGGEIGRYLGESGSCLLSYFLQLAESLNP